MRVVVLVLAALLPVQVAGSEHRLRLEEVSVLALQKSAGSPSNA